MTDLVRYTPPEKPSSSIEQAPAFWKVAEKIAGTEMVPTALKGRPEAVLAVMMAGHEAGLSPMMALQKIHIIEGRPAMSAEVMRALVMQHGHEIYFEEANTTSCTIAGRRRGTDRWTKVTWTIDDARKAGILSKQVWQKWPRSMLQARATTELCRMLFPDVLAGISYSVEELEDGVPTRELIDFGPAEVADATPPPKQTTQRAAITRESTPATPATVSAHAGEIPDLPGEEPDEAELEPDPAPPAESDESDIEDAVVVPDVEPPAPPAPPAEDGDEWSSAEWESGDFPVDLTGDAAKRYTGPQIIAIKLGDRFGIKGNTDAARAERIAAIVHILKPDHEITSSKDLSPDEIRTVCERIDAWPAGAPLYETTETGTPSGLVVVPDPAPPAPAPDPPAPIARPSSKTSPVHPNEWSGDQWRATLKDRKVKVTETMREAQRLGSLLTPPAAIGTLDDVAGTGIGSDLLGWIEDTSLERGK